MEELERKEKELEERTSAEGNKTYTV